MLTKRIRELRINKDGLTPFTIMIPHVAVPNEEEGEEEDTTWEPSDTLGTSIDSLVAFTEPIDPAAWNRQQLKQSYLNFDAWLKSEVYRIVSIEKGKEDDSAFGDL